MRPAPLSRRAIAVVLDAVFAVSIWFAALVVFVIALGILAAATSMSDSSSDSAVGIGLLVVTVAVPLLYATVLDCAALGTFGKHVVSIRVLRPDGSALSFPRAFLRALARVLSAAPLFLGYVPALFSARRRTLHDVIADTVVVDARAL